MTTSRLPRDLHPVAWWVWALGLATAASFTTNPLVLLTIVAVATLVVLARRSKQPWADAFRLYVAVAVVIVVMRVVFRVLLGGGADGGLVLLDLPEVPLPDWVMGLHLLGPVTRESVLAGLYDGLRLGTIVVCVGAANALANPKRLLRSVPAALHEVGTALVVAVTVLPQLVDSARRVRAATGAAGGGLAADGPAAPLSGAGARGRARAVAEAGRRHGHPWLRPLRRSTSRRAAAHRGSDAARALRDRGRGLRRPRPHRAAAAGDTDARGRGGRRRWPGWCWPGAGSAGPVTAPTRGAGRSSR